MTSMADSTTQLLHKLEERLGADIYKSGSVLYSSPETLKPGRFYFMGFNPGGEPTDNPKETIKAHIEGLKDGFNAFIDESWSPGGRECSPGQAPHQKNVQALAQLMDVRTEEPGKLRENWVRANKTGKHVINTLKCRSRTRAWHCVVLRTRSNQTADVSG